MYCKLSNKSLFGSSEELEDFVLPSLVESFGCYSVLQQASDIVLFNITLHFQLQELKVMVDSESQVAHI